MKRGIVCVNGPVLQILTVMFAFSTCLFCWNV